MFFFIAEFIHVIAQLLILLVIVSVILSYFVPPYHPVRQVLDRIMEPMLTPIRRVVPLVGILDLSPLILIILIGLIDQVLTFIILHL
jgi:YggT family protein